jgi:hypothetical protein
MELWNLENAIHKQCLWNYETNRRLQTDPKYETKAELGQILFIGIAEMYGFKQEEILDYIDIEPAIYKKRIAKFQKAHREMLKRIGLDLPNSKDFNHKIYIKTALVQNYIKFHYNNEGYVSYRDLLNG